MPRIPRTLALAIALAAAATGAYAQSPAFALPEAAIAALFPQQTFVEWTSTTGDWNGDGVPDLALVLNEAVDLVLPGHPIELWQIEGGLQDLWNTMLLPTLLLMVARLKPRLLGAASRARRR